MSVNSIVDLWPRYEIYQALYTKLGTTRFCISPDGSTIHVSDS